MTVWGAAIGKDSLSALQVGNETWQRRDFAFLCALSLNGGSFVPMSRTEAEELPTRAERSWIVETRGCYEIQAMG